MSRLKGKLTPSGQINVQITETGAKGNIGPEGKSAYELWLGEGNEGSVQDFLFSLQSGESTTYIYTHSETEEVWEISHPLNKYPSVTVVDSADSIVYGNVEYLSRNLLRITFIGGFNGKAYLN